MKSQKHLGIRIDADTLQKFHYVSKYNDRSANKQILYLINQCIRDFEKEHGAIALEESNDIKN